MVIRFRSIFVSLVVAAIAPLITVGGLIRDFVLVAFDWLATPDSFRLESDGWDGLELSTGTPLDRATQHFLRHEANHSHRAAARGI